MVRRPARGHDRVRVLPSFHLIPQGNSGKLRDDIVRREKAEHERRVLLSRMVRGRRVAGRRLRWTERGRVVEAGKRRLLFWPRLQPAPRSVRVAFEEPKVLSPPCPPDGCSYPLVKHDHDVGGELLECGRPIYPVVEDAIARERRGGSLLLRERLRMACGE